MSNQHLPILLVGHGRMGSAMHAGWLESATIAGGWLEPSDIRDIIISTRSVPASAHDIARSKIIVLAVKPNVWREAVTPLMPHVSPGTVFVSVMAGVRYKDLIFGCGGKPVIRAIPTLGAKICQSVTTIYVPNANEAAAAAARAIFGPLGTMRLVGDENAMDVMTAVSASGPAFLCAFLEAMEDAARNQGLEEDDARVIVHQMAASAMRLLETCSFEELRERVTSPGGTSAAGLNVLSGNLYPLVFEAVAASMKRSKELGDD